MTRVTFGLAIVVCGVHLGQQATIAAEQRKEREISSAGETPRRLVLDGVPKVRYFKDGMCPFALSLKCLTDYLDGDYSYGYILGTSGACFRMAWNYTQWDCGNMDLGRLGPEPFRQGLRLSDRPILASRGAGHAGEWDRISGRRSSIGNIPEFKMPHPVPPRFKTRPHVLQGSGCGALLNGRRRRLGPITRSERSETQRRRRLASTT